MREDRLPPLSRRDWMRLAGVGAALGILGRDLEIDAVDAAAAQARTTRVTFPRGAIIRTLLRDLPPEALSNGATLQLMPDEKKVAMVVAFLEAGHADKLLLSADFTGQRTLEAGPGYARTVTVFVPLLKKAGVSDETIHTILYDNPRRFLAFVPKRS